MKTGRLLAGAVILLLLPCVVFGEIYGWVDENGVKHYSNDPPPEGVKAFTQTAEIQTDEAQDRKRTESDRQYFEQLERQAAESGAPSKQADSTASESDAPKAVVVEGSDDESFHRERIKRRTRLNTSPAPSVENRPTSEVPQVQPMQPIEENPPARQNPMVERKRNLP